MLIDAGHCLHPTIFMNHDERTVSIKSYSELIALLDPKHEGAWQWLKNASATVKQVESCVVCGFANTEEYMQSVLKGPADADIQRCSNPSANRSSVLSLEL